MKRIVFLATLAAFVAVASASAQSTQEFKAEFNEMGACPGVDLCGKGVVHGYGTVTTTIVFTSLDPDPARTASVHPLIGRRRWTATGAFC